MHWVEWDGLHLPKRLSGHAALDFCNTWAGWGERSEVGDEKRDWLRDYDHLAAWAGFADLLDADRTAALRRAAARQPGRAADVLTEAREFRAQVYAAALDPGDRTALAAISAQAGRAADVYRLIAGDDGVARWTPTRGNPLDLPLLAVARAAADLVTSPSVRDVSACPGIDCGWLFLDSRHRRRWCDMAACGNRAKVAAHARRARSAG
ncbi:MAG: hypothetical protein HOQ22_10070 [Nocardioidaceae bacterium]|nr:hypothetical protein [Nocardioidaceae bacterium]NUS51370.1 hypothetical protein [Nocardioidaceae bacterium]